MHALQDTHRLPHVLAESRPDADRFVIGGGGEVVAAGRPGEGPDGRGVPFESDKGVPVVVRIVCVELDGVVVGCRGKDLVARLKIRQVSCVCKTRNAPRPSDARLGT